MTGPEIHNMATPVKSDEGPTGASASTGTRAVTGTNLGMFTKTFDDKVPQDAHNQYSGAGEKGQAWRIFTRNYLAGCVPDAKPLLRWAEDQGHQEIHESTIRGLQNSGMMLDADPWIVSHHVWKYLNLNLKGEAMTIFTNAEMSNGLEVWRKIVLNIDSKSKQRRKESHDMVHLPQQAANDDAVRMVVETWEGHHKEWKECGGRNLDDEE